MHRFGSQKKYILRSNWLYIVAIPQSFREAIEIKKHINRDTGDKSISTIYNNLISKDSNKISLSLK